MKRFGIVPPAMTVAMTAAATTSSAMKTGGLRRPCLPVEGVFCTYSHRPCTQTRLDGFDFCLRHILEEKSAPYRQCSYTAARSGQRCPHAAPKTDKRDGYCATHARRATSLRQKTSRKRRSKETAHTLLNRLKHHAALPAPPGGNEVGRPSDMRRMRALDNSASRILEFASSSSSDDEITHVEQTWRGDADSDAESIDSEQEDPLKHAGVYTSEEVALLTRDKLIRLQSLYIDQFKRLQHALREQRRRLLQSRRVHRQTAGGSHSCSDFTEQRMKLAKFAAVKRYHRRFGKEALLHRQSKERRISVSEGTSYRAPAYPKCTHLVPGGARCSSRTVPLSKFCVEHVLRDGRQVLFAQCSLHGGACLHPVPAFSPGGACGLHTLSLASQTHLPMKNEETTETDIVIKEEVKDDMTIDVVGHDVKFEPGAQQVAPPTATLSTPSEQLGAILNKIHT